MINGPLLMKEVLTLLLSHQPASELEPVLELWREFEPTSQILLVYGGKEPAFAEVAFPKKVFVDDPQLRVRDQQRERQSCAGVFRAAHEWLKSHPEIEYVHYVEYDQLPLVRDLYDRLVENIHDEEADVLAYKLQRIDGTSHPHYLYHASDPRFQQYFASISVRRETRVVLSMMGTGAFWRREAFDAVAAHREPFPIYTEVYVPTLAHHLGYRLRDFGAQNKYVTNLGDYTEVIEEFRSEGAWMVHPVKKLPPSWRNIVR
jgi:hypothetical protein